MPPRRRVLSESRAPFGPIAWPATRRLTQATALAALATPSLASLHFRSDDSRVRGRITSRSPEGGTSADDNDITALEARMFETIMAEPACLAAQQLAAGASLPGSVQEFAVLPLLSVELGISGATASQRQCLLDRARPLDASAFRKTQVHTLDSLGLALFVDAILGVSILLQLKSLLGAATDYCRMRTRQESRILDLTYVPREAAASQGAACAPPEAIDMDTPPAKIDIEVATDKDLSGVLALYEAAGITGDQAYTLEQARAQFQRFAGYPFYRLFVAKRAGKIVGTYEFLEMENMAKAGAKTAIVEDVAVDPTIRRAGIGRALMEHARKLAFSRGCYKLMLSSNNKRQEAHRFYESLGFLPHGVSFVATPPEP